MEIAICGLVKSQNIGELFIAESLSWIISNVSNKEHHYSYVDIIGTDYTYKKTSKVYDFLFNMLSVIIFKVSSIHIKNICYRLQHFCFIHSSTKRKKLDLYYSEKLSHIDVIIIDGAGLLEYSWNEYQEYLLAITDYAKKHKMPLVFNAIGRSGDFNKNDYRCKVLMKCFANDYVKYVSARDSAENVQECVGDRFVVQLRADAAFCLSDYHPVIPERRDVIGIGLIRANAFSSYSDGLSEDETIQLFVDIAKELNKQGYDYEFFTNGFKVDYNVGMRVIERLGVDSGVLIDRPQNAHDLVRTICSYKGIITCRMHSSICAFSFGIPSVILSWNAKVDQYMNQIGYPERCITSKDLNAKIIVERFLIALKQGINADKVKQMKDLARQSVEEYAYLFDKENNL